MKKIINLYIPDWVPIASNKEYEKKVFKKIKNLHIFNWQIIDEKEDKKQNKVFIDVAVLEKQLIDYFKKNKDVKFNVIIASFSQLIFFNIHDQIKPFINKVILLNPFDKSMYLRLINLKSKLLPLKQTDVVNKYIYLCKSIVDFGSNKEWLSCTRSEKNIFENWQLLYHKLFDQVLKISYLRRYFNWLLFVDKNFIGILSKQNPLINFNQDNYQFKTKVIEDAGYCLLWEKPNELIDILTKIIK